MKVTATAFPEVLIIKPWVSAMSEGFFFENFNLQAFDQAVGSKIVFVQGCHSKMEADLPQRGMKCRTRFAGFVLTPLSEIHE